MMKNYTITVNDTREARKVSSLGMFVNTWRLPPCVIEYAGSTIKVEPDGKKLTVTVSGKAYVGVMCGNSRHPFRWALSNPSAEIETAVMAVLFAADWAMTLEADKPASGEDTNARVEAAPADEGSIDDFDGEGEMKTLITSSAVKTARERLLDPRIQKGLSRVLSGIVIPHHEMRYIDEAGHCHAVVHINGRAVLADGSVCRISSADMLSQVSAEGMPQDIWDLLVLHFFIEADLACRPLKEVRDTEDPAELDVRALAANEKAANAPIKRRPVITVGRPLDAPDVSLAHGGTAYDDACREVKRHCKPPKYRVHVPAGTGPSGRYHREYTRWNNKPDRGFAYDPVPASKKGGNKKNQA